MGFYSATLGAEVLTVLRYKDVDPANLNAARPAGCGNIIMHAELRIGESLLMVSDGVCSGEVSYQGFMLSLWFRTAEAADGVVKALAVGGQINLAFGKSAAGDVGLVTDRFGVRWLVSATR